MAASGIYSIRVMKDGRAVQRKQVSEGLGRVDAVVVKAAAGVIYVLGDAVGATGAGAGAAPATIVTKRVGKNLHVSLNGKGNPDVPDLIIEGYFDYPPAPVMGTLEGGGLASYDLGQSANPSPKLNALQANQDAALQGESSAEQAGSAVQASLPNVVSGLGGWGWTLAALGGALALGGSGGGASSTAPPPDAAATAQNKIIIYANDNTKAAPTATDYTALGIAGMAGITAAHLAAINSAVDALAGTGVDSKPKVQAVVDAYLKILAEANGALADASIGSHPLASDYAVIGVNLGLAASSAQALSLLNDALGELASTAVDTIAKLNALAASANAVMTGAAGGTGAATSVAPTLAQLGLLGVSGVTAANLLVVQNAISATADSGLQVDTFAELQGVVTAAVNAASASLAVFANYATSGSNPAPLLFDYSSVGASGVNAGNLGSMNSAVDALTSTGVGTPYQVQSMVNAYTKILAEANGAAADASAADPTSDDFAAIGAAMGLSNGGIAGGVDVPSNALSLLNDALGTKTSADVDTVGEMTNLAAVVDKVMNVAGLATGASFAGASLTMADLTALGVNTGLADLTGEQNTVLQAIVNSADTGAGVATILALQAIVDANAA